MEKEIIGKISKITKPASKDFNKKSGGTFTKWSIGINVDDEWYNIKADNEQSALGLLDSLKLGRKFEVGDKVKLLLEAEDAQGKWWKIKAIVPFNPTDEVETEQVEDTPIKEAGALTIEGTLTIVAKTGGIKIDEGDWLNPTAVMKQTYNNDPSALSELQSKKGQVVEVILSEEDSTKYMCVLGKEDKSEDKSAEKVLETPKNETNTKMPEEIKTDVDKKWEKKNQRDYRAMAISYTKDMFIGGKLELDKMKSTAQEIYEFIWEGYTEDLKA